MHRRSMKLETQNQSDRNDIRIDLETLLGTKSLLGINQEVYYRSFVVNTASKKINNILVSDLRLGRYLKN